MFDCVCGEEDCDVCNDNLDHECLKSIIVALYSIMDKLDDNESLKMNYGADLNNLIEGMGRRFKTISVQYKGW